MGTPRLTFRDLIDVLAPDVIELAYETRDWTPDASLTAGLYEGYAPCNRHG